MAGKGDQDAIDAQMKAQGKERDDLKPELVRLPGSGSVILHSTANKSFAERLTGKKAILESKRAKMEATAVDANGVKFGQSVQPTSDCSARLRGRVLTSAVNRSVFVAHNY